MPFCLHSCTELLFMICLSSANGTQPISLKLLKGLGCCPGRKTQFFASRPLDALLATFVFSLFINLTDAKDGETRRVHFLCQVHRRENSARRCACGIAFSVQDRQVRRNLRTGSKMKKICKITAKLPHATPARRVSLYIVSILKTNGAAAYTAAP